MPPTLSYPGVYIEEVPSSVRTIAGVATSIAAFAGRAWRGAVGEPISLFSYADYEREFGGLWRGSSVSYAVQQFFLNGGTHAVVVRVVNGGDGGSTAAAPATIELAAGTTLAAASAGSWGRNLRVTVDHTVSNSADTSLFNLFVFDDPASKADAEARGGSGAREVFRNVSMAPDSPRLVTTILEQQSKLVRVQGLGAARPALQSDVAPATTSGSDGVLAGTPAVATAAAASELIGSAADKTGLHALLDTDIFNLLCLPPLLFAREVSPTETERLEADIPMNVWTTAAQFCVDRRALLVVDAPRDWTVSSAVASASGFSAIARRNAALYFPRVRAIDPLRDNQLADFAPCGTVAGVMARTDAARGVWKAPAGVEANLQGVLGLSINGQPAGLTDDENGLLNPLGINCLRSFPAIGHVVWGARTLEGADVLASQWKYVPVRRLALFLEESLFRGTQWVVFEPNDEPLWSQIRLNLGAFMHTLFQQGAFQGRTPREAYFVKCDKDTTTQTDIDNGIVNIVVGFAPLKPAEFVVIRIQQIAQQPQV
jgi:phage tail sheath protein FI